MWRQGDVLIERIAALPDGVVKLSRLILAAGDSTGQRHSIKERGVASLYQPGAEVALRLRGNLYLDVTADQATVVHPEHGPITLPRGTYRVWKQREFDDVAPRAVWD